MSRTLKDSTGLGERLKEVRTARGWTLKQISEITGVSVSSLSKFENGRADLRLASAMSLLHLLIGGEPFGRKSVRPPIGMPFYSRSSDPTEFESGGALYREILGEKVLARFVMLRATVSPGDPFELPQMIEHPGTKMFCGLSGVCNLELAQFGRVTLEPGDVVYFDAMEGHRFLEPTGGSAEVLVQGDLLHYREFLRALGV